MLAELGALGHRIQVAPCDSTEFGAAQATYCLPGGYAAASERRRDGQAVGY